MSPRHLSLTGLILVCRSFANKPEDFLIDFPARTPSSASAVPMATDDRLVKMLNKTRDGWQKFLVELQPVLERISTFLESEEEEDDDTPPPPQSDDEDDVEASLENFHYRQEPEAADGASEGKLAKEAVEAELEQARHCALEDRLAPSDSPLRSPPLLQSFAALDDDATIGIDEVLDSLNGDGAEHTKEELESILKELETENKCMYRDSQIHKI